MLSLPGVTNSLIDRAIWLADNNLQYRNQEPVHNIKSQVLLSQFYTTALCPSIVELNSTMNTYILQGNKF